MQVFEGGMSTVNTLLFGAPNQSTLDYVTNSFSNFMNTISEGSKNFFSSAVSNIDNLINGDVINKAKAILKSSKDILDHIDVVSALSKLSDIQTATPYMQRWIMTEETVFDLFMKQRCVGFSVDDKTGYIDNDPGIFGEFKFDSMMINHGMVREKTINNVLHTFVTEYDLEEEIKQRNDTALSFTEKASIHDMHTWINYYIGQGKDPTDPNGGNL